MHSIPILPSSSFRRLTIVIYGFSIFMVGYAGFSWYFKWLFESTLLFLGFDALLKQKKLKFHEIIYHRNVWTLVDHRQKNIVLCEISLLFDTSFFFILCANIQGKKERLLFFHDTISKENKRFLWLRLKS